MEAIFRVKEAWSKHLRSLETFAHIFKNCLSPPPRPPSPHAFRKGCFNTEKFLIAWTAHIIIMLIVFQPGYIRFEIKMKKHFVQSMTRSIQF